MLGELGDGVSAVQKVGTDTTAAVVGSDAATRRLVAVAL